MQRSLNPVSRLHQDEVQFRIILASDLPVLPRSPPWCSA